MKIQDREYQDRAAKATFDDMLLGYTPVFATPTGTGKSVIICKIVDLFLSKYPKKDVLILTDDSTIVMQDANKLRIFFGYEFVSVYCAELLEKEIGKITVASIQSVKDKWEFFENIGLVVIDECHRVNSNDVGTYRKFLSKLDCLLCGATASPYRTGQGYIYKKYPGINNLFDKLSIDLTKFDEYNKLIDAGYIVPIIATETDYTMDTSDIEIIGGDFDTSSKANKFDREDITKLICDDIIKRAGKKHKKWLTYGIDIQHCEHIAEYFNSVGVKAAAVHSKAQRSKLDYIADFRKGEYKTLVSVDMLTTGLDIPEVDLIAIINSSMSAIYLTQVAGRGGRPAPWINKTHCLLLDYGGNIDRHGPLNDIQIKEPDGKRRNKKTLPMANLRKCPECCAKNSIRSPKCIACDYEFPKTHKLKHQAFGGSILKKTNTSNVEVPKDKFRKWFVVDDVVYSQHQKQGSPTSLKVQYVCGDLNRFYQWIAIDKSGYAGMLAQKWVENRWDSENGDMPTNLHNLWKNRFKLKVPLKIFVDLSGKYPEILDFEFLEINKSASIEETKNPLNSLILSALDDALVDLDDKSL